LIGINGVQSGGIHSQVQSTPTVHWDKHALRLNAHQRMELFHTDTDYCTLILRVFPLDQIAHVGVDVSRDLKLFGVKLFSKYSNLCDHGT